MLKGSRGYEGVSRTDQTTLQPGTNIAVSGGIKAWEYSRQFPGSQWGYVQEYLLIANSTWSLHWLADFIISRLTHASYFTPFTVFVPS